MVMGSIGVNITWVVFGYYIGIGVVGSIRFIISWRVLQSCSMVVIMVALHGRGVLVRRIVN